MLGWYEIPHSQRGSHYKMRHVDHPERVVMMVKGRNMKIGTFYSVCNQAGLNVQETKAELWYKWLFILQASKSCMLCLN